jgi:thiamine-phosphate pyrophosphorylase
MDSKRKSLKEFKLYAITELTQDGPAVIHTIREALRGGVDIIQLRSKSLSDYSLVRLGRKIREMTLEYEKLFIMNDRVDLALAIDADGVHLGQADLSIEEARSVMGVRDKIIGKSTHSLQQAEAASREGADYIGFGPIFETPTKPTYRPVGLTHIGDVLKKVHIPVVCIGGINEQNIRSVVESGADRVAVVRAIFQSKDPRESAVHLREIVTSCLSAH